MNFYCTSLSKDKVIAYDSTEITKHFHKTSLNEADLVCLEITKRDSFIFDEIEFNSTQGKEFVVIDFTEYGYDNTDVDHFYGVNTSEHAGKFPNTEYLKLDEALKKRKIKCYFKRELPSNHAKAEFTIYPIEYPCLHREEPENNYESFCGRSTDVFFNWGWSNPSRPKLHAEFYNSAHPLNYSVVSQRSHLEGQIKDSRGLPVIFTQFIPHHSRLHMDEVLHLQRSSRISVSLNGCGVKCFRHAESPANSLMALQENSLKWTHEWTDENAIILPNKPNGEIDAKASVEKIINSLKNKEELYARYLNCVRTNNKYRKENYANQILSLISAS